MKTIKQVKVYERQLEESAWDRGWVTQSLTCCFFLFPPHLGPMGGRHWITNQIIHNQPPDSDILSAYDTLFVWLMQYGTQSSKLHRAL